MSHLLVCTGKHVLLPGNDEPQPATIVIDRITGKIVEVRQAHSIETDTPLDRDSTWLDAGDNLVLPGLVECVHLGTSTFGITTCLYLIVQLSCPSQWTRPHRLGRILDRNSSCCLWRNHHSCWYAFEFYPANYNCCQLGPETRSRFWKVFYWCCILGWCNTGKSGMLVVKCRHNVNLCFRRVIFGL